MEDGGMNITTSLSVIHCSECNIAFAVDDAVDERWRENGKTFYCPKGHSQHYGDSVTKQLQREKKRLIAEQAKHDQTRAELRETEGRRRAEKGAKTKLKKRIANGVCPCCGRTFENLQRHMTSKHPDFADTPS